MPDFDNQTLAALRGRMVRYLMRSREVRNQSEIVAMKKQVRGIISVRRKDKETERGMMCVVMCFTLCANNLLFNLFTQITLGRATKDKPIDVDLALEGPAWKISRKQGE